MLLNPLPALQSLVRAGVLRPLAPRTWVEATRQVLRDGGIRPHLLYTIHAAQTPDRPALVGDRAVTTWAELLHRVRRLANWMLQAGVGPGSAVAIMLPNRPEFIEAQAAAVRVGATVAYLNPRAPEPEARALLERVRPALLVTHRPEVGQDLRVLEAGWPFEQAIRSAPTGEPRVRRGAEGRVVVFTSGTTGRPKGAVRRMGEAGVGPLATVLGFLRAIPFHRDDTHMVVCPLYHASGSGFATVAQVLGNTLVLVERFSPEAFCRTVEEHRVTTTTVVPTMLHQLCEWPGARDHDLSSLRVVVCTGAPLREETRARAREVLGEVVYDLYGSTEMAWVSVASPRDQRRRPGTVGRPVPGVSVRILDPRGRPLPRGQVGEIWVSNPMQMEGYLDDPELTRERMRDGYISVRDLGYLDQDGYLHVVDRADDMIISGGVNVYPAEVETALGSHPAVAECAVVGLPDPRWGQRVVAAVVRSGEVGAEELIAHCKRTVSPAAVPKEVRFVARLPRNDVGKVDRRRLAQDWEGAPTA